MQTLLSDRFWSTNFHAFPRDTRRRSAAWHNPSHCTFGARAPTVPRAALCALATPQVHTDITVLILNDVSCNLLSLSFFFFFFVSFSLFLLRPRAAGSLSIRIQSGNRESRRIKERVCVVEIMKTGPERRREKDRGREGERKRERKRETGPMKRRRKRASE